MCGSNPWLFRGEAGSWEFSPVLCCSTETGVYGEIVSQHLLLVSMWGFSPLSHVLSSLSSWISFRGDRSFVAVHLVCLQEVSSGAFLNAILNPNPNHYWHSGTIEIGGRGGRDKSSYTHSCFIKMVTKFLPGILIPTALRLSCYMNQ